MSDGQRNNDKIIEALRNTLQGFNGFFGQQKFSAEHVEMIIPAAAPDHDSQTAIFAEALEKLQSDPQPEKPKAKHKKRYLFT